MRDKFAKLFNTLEMALANTKKDLASSLDALPFPRKLPLPRATWLLLVLIRYRMRQQWARDVVGKKLPEACPPSAKLCRREQPVYLPIPDMRDWRMVLHAHEQFGYLICDRPPESIRVDLAADGDDDIILMSSVPDDIRIESRWTPEWRCRQLVMPPAGSTGRGDWRGLDELVESGFLAEVWDEEGRYLDAIEGDAYRLTEAATHYDQLVVRFCDALEVAENRVLLAAALGDWKLAEEAAFQLTDHETRSLIASRVRECETLEYDDEYVEECEYDD